MDSLQIVVVASPLANMTSLYEVDLDADVLLIVPPFNPSLASQSSSPINTTTPGLRLKVSSKHLSLSSKPFKTKLGQLGSKKSSSTSSTTTTTQSDGRVHISLTPGFDPKAVTIVLNAVHGRGSKVPRQIKDLETLAKIAHFVDKFQLYDTLEIYADRWIRGLWKEQEEGNDIGNKDLVFWIYISHVFKQAEIFKHATRQAALGASGPIDTLGLPIREKIIKHIEAQRQEIVGKSLTIIHSAIQDLLEVSATTGSSSSSSSSSPCLCDKFLLGDLIKTLHKSGHTSIWSPPSVKGITTTTQASFKGILQALGSTSYHLDSHPQASSTSPFIRGTWASTNGIAKKNKRGNENGNGQLITPDSSPEQRPITSSTLLPGPRIVNGSNNNNGLPHDCAARKVFARLDDIEDLEDGVKGLDLESNLGYQLY